ncbi:MAG: cysteine--tRNA ligase [Patescibacteria group bacterium]
MKSLRLYNTLSQKIERFTPLNSKEVSVYVCGVTPYDTSHLGHAFVFLVFDTLVRFLQYKKYKVVYTQNVTDIDDPLIKKADELHTTWEALAEKWTSYLLNDFKFLNIQMPNHYVKATQELPKMIEIVKILIDKGYGYINDGNVYFSIKSFPEYGALSRYNTESMLKISAERGNDITDPRKKNPLDFVLWQESKKGEPAWKSPWSKGRPGWHIECTAMSMKYLGPQIDIHGGGTDLIFPHHESEIAQAEGFSGISPFVNIWMHCAMVSYQGEKMSKSLGNLVYVQDLAKKYSANAIRYYLLSHHYRTEWEYKEEEMKSAAEKMNEIEFTLTTGLSTDTEDLIDILSEDLNIPAVLNSKPNKEILTMLGFKL